MLKRSELQAELTKARNLVERMAKSTAEMREYVQGAEAKLKVMEAWVCVILNDTGDNTERHIEREKITEALQKYRLDAAFTEDNVALVLSVKDKPEKAQVTESLRSQSPVTEEAVENADAE